MTNPNITDLHAAWHRATAHFAAHGAPLVRTTPLLEAADLAVAWDACVATLATTFAAFYGEDAIQARFHVPQDYALFMQTIGGGWRWPHGLEWALLDAAGVVRATTSNFESCVINATEEGEEVLDTGFWLNIGWYSDKHEYLLCCETAHAYYGAIIDGEDSHPWLNGVDFAGCYPRATSFLQWIQRYA